MSNPRPPSYNAPNNGGESLEDRIARMKQEQTSRNEAKHLVQQPVMTGVLNVREVMNPGTAAFKGLAGTSVGTHMQNQRVQKTLGIDATGQDLPRRHGPK